MSYKTISYEKENHIAIITLNQGVENHAALISFAGEFRDMCFEMNTDKGIWVSLVIGTEELFSFKENNYIDEFLMISQIQEIITYSIAEPVAKIECPVIIGINGNLVGQALEVALAGDIRISTSVSQFGLPHIKKGLIPWDGGIQRLSRVVGKGKAMEMVLTGESIDATEAFRLGLVNEIVSSNDIMPFAMDAARKMALKAPIALNYAKEAILKGSDMTLEQGLRLEADLYSLLHTTMDRKEGVEAFRSKTKPYFKGI